VSKNPVSGSSSIVALTKGRCFIHNSRALYYVGHQGPGDKECGPIASQPSIDCAALAAFVFNRHQCINKF